MTKEHLKAYYAFLNNEDQRGVVIVSAFNPGHAVKQINKKLKEQDLPPFDRKHTLHQLDLENRKGDLVLSWLSE